MLVEFRVRNFKSLRDEQVLSLVAAKDDTLVDSNTIPSGIKAAPFLLRTAVLYGPNAGGKSNLIKALQYMRNVIAMSGSGMQPGQTFNVQPFKLDVASNNKSTEFEITFILNEIRHQYGFSLNSQRVTNEYLLVYKTAKPQQWFTRHYDSKTDKDYYEFSTGFKGQKNVWENATRTNSLFLSTAVQLNSEQLRPVFDWFIHSLIILNENTLIDPQFSLKMLQQPEDKQKICNFLIAADISISDIRINSREVPMQTVHFDASVGKTEIRNDKQTINEFQFCHTTKKGEALFNLNEESTGTQRLFYLTGPILDIINKGLIVIIDELDNSLHPLLVQRLVKLFQSSLNNKGAQLIFSTHDTSLLSSNLLRRDQIWFVEKDSEQASKLYSLSEFSPRKNESLERGYFMGRYSGLPIFGDWQG